MARPPRTAPPPGPNPSLRVESVPGKGRGLVAARAIPEGELIERVHVLVIPAREWPHLAGTIVSRYCFSWGRGGKAAALPMGNVSFLNHSYSPNVVAYHLAADRMMEFVALRDIAAGEELTLNYNGEPDADGPVGFAVRS